MMRGEQYHHNNPSELCDNLYLCAFRAISSKVMLDLGITCSINATVELPTFAYQKQDCMQIAVEDRVSAKLFPYFDLVADKIHTTLFEGGKVMVYCRAGMSRSASLCIAYFMRHHNMTMDEAFQFVKEKRPIIHPNPGFVRQLKQFEAKLHNRRSGLKRKFEENDYSYGQFEECIAFEETNFEDLVVIKPRPKPRIMKPKLVTPENSAMPLEIAQSYCMTDITVCLADDQIPAIAQFVPSKSKSVRTKRPGGSQHGTKPKARPSSMSHPVRPPSSLGQPVRPHTPAGHLGQDNIISN